MSTVFVLAAGVAAGQSSDDAGKHQQGVELFERWVRPTLVEHCLSCHGPEVQESELRLDSRDALIAEYAYGTPVVPGKPDDSTLLQAVDRNHDDLQMPPEGAPAPVRTVESIRRWIELGAPWPDDRTIRAEQFDLQQRIDQLPWIWQTPQRHAPPAVRRTDWPHDELDQFILARLESEGLAPAGPAAKSTWLRRVSLALIGLPPSPEQIEAFEADESPEAYERVVDRLLASPHFGERWARHWMDLMRYAESRGHESDFIIANAYQYRDYLIRAFNADLPYDRFLVEHLAGDLLPEPRLHPQEGFNESVVATGWAYLGEEVHSPVDIRQDELDRLDNRIDVFSKSTLGLTVACARCHDHKFDALRQRDYYALAGFFLSTSYRQVRFDSMEQNRRVAEKLDTLRRGARAALASAFAESVDRSLDSMADYLTAEAALRHDRDATVASVAEQRRLDAKRLKQWRDMVREAGGEATHPLHLWAVTTREAADGEPLKRAVAAWFERSGSESANAVDPLDVVVDYAAPADGQWLTNGFAFGTRPVRPGEFRVSGDVAQPQIEIVRHGAAMSDRWFDGLELTGGTQQESGRLGGWVRAGRALRTPTFTIRADRVHYLVAGAGDVYAMVDSHVMNTGPLHGSLVKSFDTGEGPPKWVAHDLARYRDHRAHLIISPKQGRSLRVYRVVQVDARPVSDPLPSRLIREVAGSAPMSRRQLAERYAGSFRAAVERLRNDRVLDAADAAHVAELAAWMMEHPSLFASDDEGQRKKLTSAAAELLAAEAAAADELRHASRTAVAMWEGSGVDEFVLHRGNYRRPTERALRQAPEAFGESAMEIARGSGRLDLAERLVRPGHPLVARVMVNRVWHHLFGRGIVATVDNFGYLGQRPTHPELLDTLAHDFMHRHEWSVKQLIRRLVLSSTYRMASNPGDPQAEQRDPNNLLLHRMPQRRLEAEAVRDAMLAVSGRLDPKPYGPPVPVHLTSFIIGRGRPGNSGPLDGHGRRSVYVAVRRNFLPTMMLAFDMPTPFGPVGRRDATNVPAQALVMMNDPFVAQQAGLWARQTLQATPAADATERIRLLFRTALARDPSATETQQIVAAVEHLAANYGADRDDERVWTDVCHALFALKEFIYVR